jgi:hypothetical protein
MRRKITNRIWEQMKTAYASGIGLRELARDARASDRAVLAHAHREGWTQRTHSAKALAKPEDVLAATGVGCVFTKKIACGVTKRTGIAVTSKKPER